MSQAYKAAGVDLQLSNDVSRVLYEAGKHTWPNREGVYGEVRAAQDTFRGLRTWGLEALLEAPEPEKMEFDQDADGIGTKVRVSQRMSRYDTAGFDLMAMAADDPASRGLEPAIVTTVLSVNRLEAHMKPSVDQLALGAINAAAKARVAIKGGETAVMGDIIGGYGDPEHVLQYDWTATVHAVGHRDRLIDGNAIRPGQTLVALREHGFRSNGMSLVQKTYERIHGELWHEKLIETQEGMRTLGELVLLPSIIYTPVLVDAIGGYDLRRQPQAVVMGAAHISGGGIVEKLGDLLRAAGFGADLENLYEPSEGMYDVQKKAEVPDQEIYGVLNEGQGMIVATSEPGKFIRVCQLNGVEAKEAGEVIKEPVMRLRSNGAFSTGKKLVYPLYT